MTTKPERMIVEVRPKIRGEAKPTQTRVLLRIIAPGPRAFTPEHEQALVDYVLRADRDGYPGDLRHHAPILL